MSAKTKTVTRKHVAKPLQSPRSGSPGAQGHLTKAEVQNLVIQARDAFLAQQNLKQVEPGQTFDEWRRDQVMECAGVAGISKLIRTQWRTVKAHFLVLSGREDEAFALLQQTGIKTYRSKNPGDTWETSEVYVAHIRAALEAHEPVEVDHPKGKIHASWLLAAARQRNGKPGLSLDNLAERLDPETLCGLLAHLRNHIALREGRATDRRAKRIYPSPPDPHTIDDPF